MLEEIDLWEVGSASCAFRLNGLAGAGKTTTARTLAGRTGQATVFFFQEETQDSHLTD